MGCDVVMTKKKERPINQFLKSADFKEAYESWKVENEPQTNQNEPETRQNKPVIEPDISLIKAQIMVEERLATQQAEILRLIEAENEVTDSVVRLDKKNADLKQKNKQLFEENETLRKDIFEVEKDLKDIKETMDVEGEKQKSRSWSIFREIYRN